MHTKRLSIISLKTNDVCWPKLLYDCSTAFRDETFQFLISLLVHPVCQSAYKSICLAVCLSVCQSVCLSIYLSVCLSVFLSVCLSFCLSFCLSVCLSVCQFHNLPSSSIPRVAFDFGALIVIVSSKCRLFAVVIEIADFAVSVDIFRRLDRVTVFRMMSAE